MKTKDEGQQWADECKQGRKLADDVFNALASEPERLPTALATIREMALREDGVGCGFLTRLAARAV